MPYFRLLAWYDEPSLGCCRLVVNFSLNLPQLGPKCPKSDGQLTQEAGTLDTVCHFKCRK